jgi:hypothetical protein
MAATVTACGSAPGINGCPMMLHLYERLTHHCA